MILPGLLLGLLLTVFGATAAAALVTTGRRSLVQAVSRRLKGGHESLAWVEVVDRDLAAAAATTSIGVILMGAVFPAVFAGFTVWRLALVVVVLTVPVVVLSGYLLPRWLSHARAERVVALAQPLLRPLAHVLAVLLPVRAIAGPAEVRALVQERVAAGFGPDRELVMVGGIMAFAQRLVRDVMSPRTAVVALPESASLEEITRVFTESGYSRIPVYRGSLDEIVGMLHVFDLFRVRPGDPLPVRPVAFAPATRTAGDLLIDLQRERRHLAVVLDEFGGTLGIVTMEDLLEEMVGEIYDEHDDAVGPTPATAGLSELLDMDGAVPVQDLERRLGVTFPPGHADTIGGRLAELLGRIPAAGERFSWQGVEVDIVRATPTRIERVFIRNESSPLIALPGTGG